MVDVRGLKVRFYTYEGIVKAVEGVDLKVVEGETMGVVGETGSGKTVTSYSIIRLIPAPGRLESGTINFKTERGVVDLAKLGEDELLKIRGKDISMIFQEPNAALNPTMTIGDQVIEPIMKHRYKEMVARALEEVKGELQRPDLNTLRRALLRFELNALEEMLRDELSMKTRLLSRLPLFGQFKKRIKKMALKEAERLLAAMGIPDPARVLRSYPHELSGGMKQRVVIAMALTGNPKILIADEPTTSLDVTVQAQVLELIKRTKDLTSSSVIYITHDMGVIAEMCDRVAVMYAGTVCEVADVYELFKNPMHPYTKALIESIPRPGAELKSIPGMVPNLIEPPPGCRFHPRCPYAKEICKEKRPPLKEVKPGHFVACHLYGGEYGTPDKGIRP